jgi:acyl carrier protein
MTSYEGLKRILVNDYKIDPGKLTPEARLEDLGLDSLAVMEMVFAIEDEFRIKAAPDGAALATVGEVAAYIDRLVAEQHASLDPGAAP